MYKTILKANSFTNETFLFLAMKQPFSFMSNYSNKQLPKQPFSGKFLFSGSSPSRFSKNGMLLDAVTPSIYDIMLLDVCDKDVEELVAPLVNAKHLGETQKQVTDEVIGIIYGSNFRLFAPFIVEMKGKIKEVVFLIDNGAPKTYVTEKTLRSFGADPTRIAINMQIHGIKKTVEMSHSHFAEINVIGSDFLKQAQATMLVDYMDYKEKVSIRLFQQNNVKEI